MKTNVLIVAAAMAVAFACTQDESTDTPQTPEIVVEAASQKEFEGSISIEEARRMIGEFDKWRNTSQVARTAGKSISGGWHSLEYYQDYLAYLDDIAKELDIEITGIVTYFAAYPETGKVFRDQNGQLAFVYYPTILIDGKHVPFDPSITDDKGNLKSISEILHGREELPNNYNKRGGSRRRAGGNKNWPQNDN